MKLSQLFRDEKDTLLIYSYVLGAIHEIRVEAWVERSQRGRGRDAGVAKLTIGNRVASHEWDGWV